MPWSLIIVQHYRETKKPSNTARFLSHVVEECDIVRHGLKDSALPADRFQTSDRQQVVLYPEGAFCVLDRERMESYQNTPTTFIVPDGSWRHTNRIVRRVPGLCDLPRVALPAGAPSRWTIRRASNPERLCTFEAVVRLSALSGDRDTAKALDDAYQLLIEAQVACRPGGQPRLDPRIEERPRIKER